MDARIGLAVTALSLLSVTATACGSSPPGDGTTLGGGGGNGIDIDGGVNDDDATNLVNGNPDANSNDETSAACAATSSKATATPLDIFIMQDQSGSMKDPDTTGTTKWDAMKTAMKAFLADPKSAGIGVGIQYFAQQDSGSVSCNVADYAKPEVEIAALPGALKSLEGSLDAHSPNGGTPTGPALQGALQHATAWAAAHPTHTVVVVLATDGLPTSCSPKDIPSIAALAKTAAGAKPAIRTFVIGVLSDTDISKGADTNLNDISKAGNGANAFIISTGTAVAGQFQAALDKIRGTKLACEYEVPKGVGADYNKVNIAVTLNGKTSIVKYVEKASACDPTAGGWYYDVPPSAGTPTKIEMCDATCNALASDAKGSIDIQVGCTTQIK